MELKNIKPKTTVLGIGGAGIRTVRRLCSLKGAEWLNPAVADTDESALNEAGLEHSFAVGIEWTRGLGCGGNPSRGGNAFAQKSQKAIEEFISGSSLLIVTGGLGGGSATGGAPVIGRLARRLKIPGIFIMTTPFAFEGQSRHEISEEGLKMLLPDTDIVIPIPNDILFSSLKSDVPAKEAFRMVDDSLAHAVLGVAEVIRCGNILATDFSDFKEVLGSRKTLCRIGLGRASSSDGENRCNIAAERLLDSPLLGGLKGISEADAVIATLIGGSDLQIGEMKQAMETVKGLTGPETRIICGINTDTAYEDNVFITLLAVSFDKKEIPEKNETAPRGLRRSQLVKSDESRSAHPLLQPELAFQSPSRGYFAKTPQNIVKGEDIDIPPFQRDGLTLDKGI